ncbi:MAG: prephenate dehydratase [Actinomycetota bacterium]|nr:prephenate dehydratase [Actinomycetota bacterium]
MRSRVAYQGDPGAFSEEAARVLFPDGEAVPHRTLREAFGAVTSGLAHYGVVPVENSQAGSINETYDLLASGGAWIVGEVVVNVAHALLALPGTRLEEVRVVSSHPQALAQCQEFLAGLDAEVVAVFDTAGAARRIADQGRTGEAAVASERAAGLYGLEVLASGIQTDPGNRTRFAAIATDHQALGKPDKTSLTFATPDVPGALVQCLRQFADRGLNLSKLESRPLGGGEAWRYRFFLDVEAGLEDPALQAALADLERDAAVVRVLGSYPRWKP